MRTIVHLSDLHFGRIDPGLVEPLSAQIRQIKPDLVAISGDFTQRARETEFRQARAFLDSLPQPRIVVPGNHDVPLYNILARFLRPLENYRRWISDDLAPVYQDDEIVVAGINTARSLVFKGGRVNAEQAGGVYDRLCVLDDRVTKIVVTHHPFELPAGYGSNWLVGRARMAMERLAACGADILLAGHLHLSYTGRTAERYRIAGHSALVVQAGTATSTRGRGEFNSFNVLRVQRPRVAVEKYSWRSAAGGGKEPGRGGEFLASVVERFIETPEGWVPE